MKVDESGRSWILHWKINECFDYVFTRMLIRI
jgi:hypothetical protein